MNLTYRPFIPGLAHPSSKERVQPRFAADTPSWEVIDLSSARAIVGPALARAQEKIQQFSARISWSEHTENDGSTYDKYDVPRSDNDNSLDTFQLARRIQSDGSVEYSLSDHTAKAGSPGVVVVLNLLPSQEPILRIAKAQSKRLKQQVVAGPLHQEVQRFFEDFFSPEQEALMRQRWLKSTLDGRVKNLEQQLAEARRLQAQGVPRGQDAKALATVLGSGYDAHIHALTGQWPRQDNRYC